MSIFNKVFDVAEKSKFVHTYSYHTRSGRDDEWRGDIVKFAEALLREFSDGLCEEFSMKFDPVDGSPNPNPSQPYYYRKFHGKVAWLYNPYTGEKRDPRDIGSDVLGLLLLP